MADVIENDSKFEVHAVVRFYQAEGVSQSEIHRRLVSVYDQNVFSGKEVFVWCNKFKHGRTAFSNPKKHIGRPRTLHIDENCVIFVGLIKEDRRITGRETAALLYFTSLGKEHYREGMFKRVKQWDKCLNANVDYVKK
jgi:hypothetical protein